MVARREDEVRDMFTALPGVTEGISYRSTSFKVKDKSMARFHEDGVSLVLKMDFDTRDLFMRLHPEIYYITDHYRNYPLVLVNLSKVDPKELKGHLLTSWRMVAPKKLVQQFESEMKGSE